MYQVLSIGYFKKIFLLLLLVTCHLLIVTAPAQAQTMSNQSYIIQTEKIDTAPNTTANANDNSQTAVKPNPEPLEGVNFKIKKGFANLAPAVPFSISLSSDTVDFGALSPTNPIIRTVDLSMNSEATNGYSILVFENEPLTTISSSKTFIPDTTCDNGQCSAEDAAEWTNALTYGFGYRCDNLAGAGCDSSFAKINFYKHFSDIANNDDPQSIMAGVSSNNQAARISYKVNISGNQAQGAYKNTVTYIAVPNF